MAARNPTRHIADEALEVTGKRPFDHEDIYQSNRERPNKRARVEHEESSTDDLRVKPSAGRDEEIIKAGETTDGKVVMSVDHSVLGNDSKKIGISLPILKQKSVSQRVKKFESMIQPKRPSPPTDINVKGAPIS